MLQIRGGRNSLIFAPARSCRLSKPSGACAVPVELRLWLSSFENHLSEERETASLLLIPVEVDRIRKRKMFKRRATRNVLFDRLHKGVVISCLALTLYGSFLLGNRLYTYFTVLRPQLKAKQEEEQKQLLSEGKASSDVSVIVDPASNLKA